MKIKLRKNTVAILALIVQLGFITGCQTMVDERGVFNHRSGLAADGPAILATGNREEICQAAIADARADIAARKPRIAITGGIAAWPVGVPQEYFDLVKTLPKVPPPTGCTSPMLEEAGVYAEAYNGEILPYLLNQKEFLK